MTAAIAAIALLVVAGGLPVGAHAADARVARLDNGMTVIVRENPVAPVVGLSLMLRMGVRWEGPENAGISNFLQAVMVKGTARRSGAEMAELIAALGGKLSAAGDVDYSEIQASALARFWRDLLALTAELALEPKLAPDEVDRERDWLLSRVERRADNAFARAFDVCFATLYGTHPYANPVLGTRESLERIDHAALVAWYRRFYRPERMVLAVSGQVSADEVIAEARRLFGAVASGGGGRGGPIPPPEAAPRAVVVEQPAQQAHVLVAALAPALGHPDHAAVKVLSTVLGGGMAGRLFAELRDREALAYTAATYYDPTREPGALVLHLGTAPANAARAEAGLRAAVERIRTAPIRPEELERAKAYLLGSYAMDRRTNARQAWYLAFYQVEGEPLDFPDRFRKAVARVTIDDVQRVARTYLDRLTTVVLRPRP